MAEGRGKGGRKKKATSWTPVRERKGRRGSISAEPDREGGGGKEGGGSRRSLEKMGAIAESSQGTGKGWERGRRSPFTAREGGKGEKKRLFFYHLLCINSPRGKEGRDKTKQRIIINMIGREEKGSVFSSCRYNENKGKKVLYLPTEEEEGKFPFPFYDSARKGVGEEGTPFTSLLAKGGKGPFFPKSNHRKEQKGNHFLPR